MDSKLQSSLWLSCDTPLAFRVTLRQVEVRASWRALQCVDRKLKRNRRILTWAVDSKDVEAAVVKQGDPALELPQYAAISNVIQICEALTLGLALALQLANVRSKWAQEDEQEVSSAVHAGRAAAPNSPVSLSLLDASVLLAILSLSFALLRRLWKGLGSSRQHSEQALSASGGTRLLRLEVLHARQTAAMANTERELNKLRVRSQVLGRDVKPTLRQLQAENAKQAEAMARIVERLESLDGQVVDTQGLIAALQGASMKQLQLVASVLEAGRTSGA